MCTTFRSMSSGSECLSFLFALSPVDTFPLLTALLSLSPPPPALLPGTPLQSSARTHLRIAKRLLLIKNGRQRTAASRQWQMGSREMEQQ